MTTVTRDINSALAQDTTGWEALILGANNLGGALTFGTKNAYYGNIDQIPLTDMDAGEWIKRVLGNKYTYVNSSKTGGDWYFWDGTVHVLADTNNTDDKLAKAFTKAITKVLNSIVKEVRMSDNFTVEDKSSILGQLLGQGGHMAFVKGLANEGGLKRMRARVKSELSVAADYFDHDTDYIVLSDGRVMNSKNLTAELMAPDASRPVTNKMGVTFGGVDTKAGLWVDFLNRLGLAEDDQKYLQLMAGAALVGRADTKNIAALVGVSNTGKTSYAMSVFKAFGSYAGNLPAGAIVDKGSVNFDQYKARGKRFILLEEPYEKRTDDSFLKNFSGAGGMVSTQEKGKNGVDWKPQGVLHITANHVPKIDTKDDAIVKRMNIVGFNIKGEKIVDVDGLEPADIHMRDCSNEIFEWILEGAKEYNETRTVVLSEAIKKAAQVNVANGSVVIRWLLEQTEWVDDVTPPRWELHATTTHSAMVPASKDEYFNFNMWCGTNNEKVVSKATWADEINRFMAEPDDKAGKRPGGSVRLWGVSERDNAKTIDAINLGNSSALFAQKGTNHMVLAQR